MPGPNYDLIWAQNSPLTPYEFSDAEYLEGWNTVGSTPPARTMFDALQRRADLKAQDLNTRVESIETTSGGQQRQEGQAYEVGQYATTSALPTGWYLKCIVAGNTSTNALVIPSPKVGDLVTDGSVTWQVLNWPYGQNVLTRSTPYTVGAIVFNPNLAGGLYLSCVTAGTTGTQEPTAALIVAIDGTQITDGTAVFTVNSIGAGGLNLLQRNKAYAVGDIAYSRNLPSYLRLECVTAGTTGTTEPDFSGVSTGGGIIVDGTCTFIIDDVRDGTPVGQVRASMFLPAGYVKLEGGTVNRSNYPRLVALADKYSLWTSDTASNPGLFGKGNGSTTMVLPNWSGRMAQFAATAGSKVDAGLPNIVGTCGTNSSGSMYTGANRYGTGAFYETIATFQSNAFVSGNNDWIGKVKFDASKSSNIFGSSTTVQPPAINTFAIMRY